MFADQCLHVNKSLNSISSTKQLDSYGLVLQSFYKLFEASKVVVEQLSMEEQKSLRFHKKYLHLRSDGHSLTVLEEYEGE